MPHVRLTCPGVPWGVHGPKKTGRSPISAKLQGFFSKRPQNRHPERSASQSLSIDTAFRRGVEGPRRCLSCRCCLEFSDTRAREHDSPCGFLCSLTRKHKLLITQQGRPRPGGPPGASFGGGKGTNSVGTISSSGVLRLRALNPVSPDKICEAPRSG